MIDTTATKTTSLDVGLIAAAAVMCFLPAILIGTPTGPGDLSHHLQLAGAYADSFRSGIFYPSWIDAENLGYGSVTVRFYPPLAHYTLAALKLLLGSWHLACFATFTIWAFVGGLGTYLWAKDSFGDRIGAIAAALLFTVAPYHLNQYYNSFMWAEFVALSLMPFAFLFTRRVIAERGFGSMIGLGVVYGLLILSNLPQLIIGTLAIGVYSAALSDRTNISRIVRVGTSLLVGVLLTSYYWVRMVAEMDWLVVAQPNTDPLYDFRNHFLLANFSLDDRFVWFATVFLVLGVAAIVGAILASGAGFKILRDRNPRAVIAFSLLAFLLMLPFSRPLWELITPLQRIQFPWRMLSLISLGSAALVGYSIATVRREMPATSRARLLVLAGLLSITATFSVKQVVLGAVYTEPTSFDVAADAMTSKPSLEHWLPTWAAGNRIVKSPSVVAGDRVVQLSDWSGSERSFIVESGPTTDARLALMYYPHWHATVNGVPTDLTDANGATGIRLGAERSEVEIEFVEPSYTFLSQIVSLLTLICVAGASIYLAVISRIRNERIA